VSYMYQLKDPRGHLRKIVLDYLKKMRVLGRRANRSIKFMDAVEGEGPDGAGWLLVDPRVENVQHRYLLMDDGDVWHECIGEACETPVATDKQWLGQPTDDLATLLPKSLLDAQMGGTGFMLDEESAAEGPLLVGDRREGQKPFQGLERRRRP
jgi:hypothetical protein